MNKNKRKNEEWVSKKSNTCANSTAPDTSMAEEFLDIIRHESGMAESESDDTPYHDLAKYTMIPRDDEGIADSSQS